MCQQAFLALFTFPPPAPLNQASHTPNYSEECKDLLHAYYEGFPEDGDDDDPIAIPTDKPIIILGNTRNPICLIGQAVGYDSQKAVAFWHGERRKELKRLAETGLSAYLDYVEVDELVENSGKHGVILMFAIWEEPREETKPTEPDHIMATIDELNRLEVHHNEPGRILRDVARKNRLMYRFPIPEANGYH